MNKSHLNFLYFALLLFVSSLSLAEDNIETLKIGFGSCVDEARPQPIWKAVEKENLNEFFYDVILNEVYYYVWNPYLKNKNKKCYVFGGEGEVYFYKVKE